MDDNDCGPPWLTVLTTPKRPQYLVDTCNAIDDAGGRIFPGWKMVLVDGPSVDYRTMVPEWGVRSLTQEKPPEGTRMAIWKIMRWANIARAPYLLYFEDDIRLSAHAVTAMSRYPVPPDLGFLSFFSMDPRISSEPGIHRTNNKEFWGTQALKIPYRSLTKFRDENTEPRNQHRFSADIWLGMQLSAGVVVPSLVRHIGEVSAVQTGQGVGLTGKWSHRGGLHYMGDNFNALSILDHHAIC